MSTQVSFEVNLPDFHGDEWRAVPQVPGKARYEDAQDAALFGRRMKNADLDYPMLIDGLRVRSADDPAEVVVFDITVECVP